MSKKKKIIVIIIFVFVILCTVLASIGYYYEKPVPVNNEEKEEVKPKIIEEYTAVELNTLKDYGDHYLDYEDNKVSYYDDENRYIVYKNGVLLGTPEVIKEDNNYYENIKFKKYEYYLDKDFNYCLKDLTNNELECFNEIQKISNYQDSIDYLILIKEDKNNNKTIKLLNPNTGKLIDLTDLNIDYVEYNTSNDDENIFITQEYDYLPVCTSFYKCGLINYDGKILIDYVYDSMDYVNANTIVVSKNEKFGIINYKNQVLLPLEYDNIEVFKNHIITIKDFKLNVLNRNLKVLVNNIDIDTTESETGYNYYINIQDNNLYLYVDNNMSKEMYLLNNKLQRKIETFGELEYVYDNDSNLKYITFSYIDNNTQYIVFYDLDLYEYYTFSKTIKNNIDFYTNIDVSYKNNNYYIISFNYEIPKYNEYYYVDLINSKETDEITALGKHFSNGYTYTITNNKLNIYKEKELLNSFEGTFTHLNEYTFIQTTYNNSKIVTLEFKKESREI